MINPEILAFFEFVFERQRIWHKRFVLEDHPPWTEDPILQKMFFCNVYRQLDKGTQYLMKETTGMERHNSMANLLFNVVAYRFFNTPNFFQLIGGRLDVNTFDYQRYADLLDKRIGQGQKIWNSAYTVSQSVFDHSVGKKGKHYQILKVLEHMTSPSYNISQVVANLTQVKDEVAFNEIRKIPLVGDFLAYEIFCDLSYIDLFPWTDNDFVNIGPGASTGITLIIGKQLEKLREVKYCKFLRDVQPIYFAHLAQKGKEFEKVMHMQFNVPQANYFLSLRNTEHSICEFRKYLRLKSGQGRKRYYKKGLAHALLNRKESTKNSLSPQPQGVQNE